MENKKEHKKRNIFSIFKNLKNNLNISKKYKIEAMKSQQKISNPSDDVTISIQHVTKIFKNVIGTPFKVLDDISFEVKKGDFHGFIGNNGAGKTTTIRLILNYYQNGYGKIFINGIDSKNKHAKDKIGYIPEISVFPKNLTIYEYLYYFAKLSKLSNIEAKNKIDQLLSKYGFNSSMFNKSADKLSSGQKKKILLIQALINDPDILIMDEPAANLDPSARLEFFDAVNELHKQGKTIFMSSHILTELEKYIDSFTILENGHVKDFGRLQDKLRNNEYQYSISSDNNSKLEKLCINEKFKCKLMSNSLLIKIENIQQKNKLFKIAFDNDIDILSFKENKTSLNEIYFNTSEME